MLSVHGTCHSVGAWDKLSKGQLARLQAALVGGYRCAVSMPHHDPTRDRSASDEVLAACGKLGMATRLSLARLRLLGPVVLHGPQVIHRLFDYLVARDCGWPGLIVGDLDLVPLHWGWLVGRGLLPCQPGFPWFAAILACGSVDSPMLGAGPLRRMSMSACVSFGAVLLMAFSTRAASICPKDLPLSRLSVAFCATNVAVPLPLLALGIPIGRRVHGARHPARALAFGTACSGGCMEFHTKPRLLWHNMYSVFAFLAAYASFFELCDDATVDVAEQRDRADSRALRKAGEYDRVAKMPAVRIYGCALPPAAQVLGGEAPGVLPPLVPVGPAECGAQRTPVALHRYLEATVCYVLHFFSGQRFLGDYQDLLDQAFAVVHYPVWVMSLDVAIDAKLCNLFCSGGVARWLDLAIAGRVVMVLGGPPCETWSVARWNGGSRVIVQGHRLLGRRSTFGACMISTRASASRLRLGKHSCARSSCSLQPPVCTALPLSWSTHSCPAGCHWPRPR